MKIEQVLHGYNNGHTVLQTSIKGLSANDMSRMDILSDWSGYQDSRDDSSYITAYPLRNTPYYVVAKSWYAYEMERPGCVWTHSLLLNLDDIDKNFDFRVLLTYFRRPVKSEFEGYDKSIEVVHFPVINGDKEKIPIDEATLLFVYSSLFVYDKPFAFKTEMSALDNQKFCLSLLQFMPLQMLRHISMSSGGNSLRQVEGNVLTMQFVQDNSLMSLLAPPWADKVKIDDFHNGARFLLQEALDGRNNIAPLIRIFSKDIGTSYQKLCAVGDLLRMLNRAMKNKVSSEDYKKVLDVITSFFPEEEGLLVKSNFLGDTIRQLFVNEEDFLFYVSTCKNEKSLPMDLVQLPRHFGNLNNEDDKIYLIERIFRVKSYNSFGKELLEYLFCSNSSSWLDFDKSRFAVLLPIFESSYDVSWNSRVSWSKLWDACLCHNVDVSMAFADMVRSQRPHLEMTVYDKLNRNEMVPSNIVSSCLKNVSNLLEWLRGKTDVSENVVSLILKHINPNDTVIQKQGIEPWRWIEHYSGSKTLGFDTFVFFLSFNWVNDEALKMLKISFYSLHEVLALGNEQAFLLLDKIRKYTDELPISENWDNCKKLRKGVVKYLKRNGYKKSVLENFTPDKQVNEWLQKLW